MNLVLIKLCHTIESHQFNGNHTHTQSTATAEKRAQMLQISAIAKNNSSSSRRKDKKSIDEQKIKT